MFAIIVIMFVLTTGVKGHAEWSYDGGTGPAFWGNIGYPTCAENNQSPIDLQNANLSTMSITPFELTGNWSNDQTLQITNNGHSVQATLSGEYISTGGPLNTTRFVAEQFHFHWGMSNEVGSEHTVDGNAYPAEMHVVHYDASRFSSVSSAMKSDNGLAVFGFFLDIGQYINSVLQPLIDAVPGLEQGENYSLGHTFNLRALLPENLDNYWTYSGSLTTPPCYESVIWTVFRTPIMISQSQMKAFRRLGDANATSHPIINNFRPTQGVNQRTITQHGQPPT